MTTWRTLGATLVLASTIFVQVETAGRQVARVLPVGKFAVLRRSRRVAASRPMTSSLMSTRRTSAGSQRWAWRWR